MQLAPSAGNCDLFWFYFYESSMSFCGQFQREVKQRVLLFSLNWTSLYDGHCVCIICTRQASLRCRRLSNAGRAVLRSAEGVPQHRAPSPPFITQAPATQAIFHVDTNSRKLDKTIESRSSLSLLRK